MTLTMYIPGMAPGRTQRNLVVFGVYLVCFPLVPFILSYAVFSNYNRISDRLAMRNTPGFTPGGGAKPAAVTLVALLVTISVIASLSVAPFLVLGDDGGSDASAEDGNEIESDDPTVGDNEREGDEADDAGTDGFDGGEFIGESDPEENLSQEEREEATAEAFEEILREEGYEVTDAWVEDEVIYIEYRTYAEDRAELDAEIADFSVWYIAYDDILQNEMADEYEGVFVEQTERLHVTIVDYNDVEQGFYYIEGEWARAVYSDEISDDEFEERVEETIEISDEFDNNGSNDSSADDSSD